MDLHERAWQGIKILIYCRGPLARQISDALVSNTSINSEQIVTFEKYADAYNYCKEQGDIGFFIVHEETDENLFVDIFRELSKYSDSADFPAFGIICHDDNSNSFNLKISKKIPHLLDYIPVSYLTDDKCVAPTIENVWSQVCEAFEDEVLPEKLQDSLVSCAEDALGLDGIHFSLRLVNNFLSTLDVSWFENIAIKWAPILEAVNSKFPAVIRPHRTLTKLIDTCKPEEKIDDTNILSFLESCGTNCQKVFVLTCYLNEQRAKGQLESAIDFIIKQNTTVKSILVAHLARNKERILTFQNEANSMKKIGEAA